MKRRPAWVSTAPVGSMATSMGPGIALDKSRTRNLLVEEDAVQ